jgi:hypothetical protein
MTETESVPVVVPGKPVPAPPANGRSKPVSDPDRFLKTAKRLAVDNYNSHRDPNKSPELMLSSVYIIRFSKTLSNWNAVIASPIIRGWLWEITYNGYRKEAYIETYRKVNNVRVELEDNEL